MKCSECEVDWEEVFEDLEKMKKKKEPDKPACISIREV